jgi:AcrR family transcriptional regulator
VSSTEVPPRSQRGPGRPPDVVGDDTREAIRRATQRLVGTHGYFSATTRMIADEVGVTPAALHHYFGRKKDLVLSVWQSTMDEEFEGLYAAISGQETFVGKVHAVLDRTFQVRSSDRDKSIFIVTVREEARRTPELSGILEDSRTADLIRNLVQFGVDTGSVRADDAQAVRGVIRAMSLGATVLGTDLSPKSVEAMVDGCKRLFEGSLVQSIGPNGQATK